MKSFDCLPYVSQNVIFHIFCMLWIGYVDLQEFHRNHESGHEHVRFCIYCNLSGGQHNFLLSKNGIPFSIVQINRMITCYIIYQNFE